MDVGRQKRMPTARVMPGSGLAAIVGGLAVLGDGERLIRGHDAVFGGSHLGAFQSDIRQRLIGERAEMQLLVPPLASPFGERRPGCADQGRKKGLEARRDMTRLVTSGPTVHNHGYLSALPDLSLLVAGYALS